MNITADQIRVGDEIRREIALGDPQTWHGVVKSVSWADSPEGHKLVVVEIFDQRGFSDERFLRFDATITLVRRGFEEVYREHLPSSLGMVRCTLCGALVDEGYEETHIHWHQSILSQIRSASLSHLDLSGGR